MVRFIQGKMRPHTTLTEYRKNSEKHKNNTSNIQAVSSDRCIVGPLERIPSSNNANIMKL